ncbi:hypothetical protein APHAL10511_002812, partial [Amanita phalloides]
MKPNPINLLKAGLAKLKNQVRIKKDDILAHLHNHEKILPEEEEWLDNDANPFDKDTVVNMMETASDYDQMLTQLTSQQRHLVDKLTELGGGLKKAPLAKKRK